MRALRNAYLKTPDRGERSRERGPKPEERKDDARPPRKGPITRSSIPALHVVELTTVAELALSAIITFLGR